MTRGKYVQYGAGFCCPDGWLNFDASPTVYVQRIPIFGHLLVPKKQRFPRNVIYGDIVCGLPLTDASVEGIYASHVLEHLALEECRCAIRNTFRLLRPGGIFRCIVPDLAERARRYLVAWEAGDYDASLSFIRACGLGREARARSLIGMLRTMLGNSGHLWMWDERSLTRALEEAGFINIRPCRFGDAEDPLFSKVENQQRFIDSGYTPEVHEVALEAKRPI